MVNSSSNELVTLAMAEHELFSLYAQYPEINFDPECCQKRPDSSQHFSSPASNAGGERDEIDSVQASNSTRHTTPLRHDLFNASSANADEYTYFCSRLRDCDLPPETVHYFKHISSQFIQLGRLLMTHNTSNVFRASEDPVREISESILPQLEHSTVKVQQQIETVAFLTELAPFNILPTDISLWSNYKQRASLICKYLSCPSQTEVDLLTKLTHLVDAYVYNPYLHLRGYHDVKKSSTSNESGSCLTNPAVTIPAFQQVPPLYNALLTLLSSYQRWLRTLLLFRKTYMTPLMRRIQNSPWILQDIEAVELTLEAAKLALSRSNEKDSQNAKSPAVGIHLSKEEVQRIVTWAKNTKRVQSRIHSGDKYGRIVKDENENTGVGTSTKEGFLPGSGFGSALAPGVPPKTKRRYKREHTI